MGKTLRFTVRFNDDLPVYSKIRQVIYVHLDLDNSVGSGQKSNYDSTFGYDYSFSLARPAKENRFKLTGDSVYGNVNRKPNDVKVDSIKDSKNEVSFDVETNLLLKAEAIKFNIALGIAVMDDLHRNEIASRETLDRLGDQGVVFTIRK